MDELRANPVMAILSLLTGSVILSLPLLYLVCKLESLPIFLPLDPGFVHQSEFVIVQVITGL